jgi:hypothetical protein
MKMHLRSIALVAAVAGAGLAFAAPPGAVNPAFEINEVPAIPQTPAAIKNLLYARPFTLAQGYEFEWRSEHPRVTSGWVLVLEVNPALVFPRQTAEPILYVGETTGERVNIGHQSGRVIAIVPSTLNDKGEVDLSLSEALMWFGTPGLPEQVDAAKIASERQSAQAAGIAPFAGTAIETARQRGGEMLQAPTREALRHAAAELIRTWSPQEGELADTILREGGNLADPPAGK